MGYFSPIVNAGSQLRNESEGKKRKMKINELKSYQFIQISFFSFKSKFILTSKLHVTTLKKKQYISIIFHSATIFYSFFLIISETQSFRTQFF